MDPNIPVNPNPEPLTQTQPEPILPQNIPPATKKRSVKGIIMILLSIMLVLGLILAGYYWFSVKQGNLPLNTNPLVESQEYEARQWINCNDVREVIEEGSNLYVACLGGVLVVDSESGEVKDQIGTPQGLGNATATSLVKRNDDLYIGTQDGFTIFNLKSRVAKKISVSEGLVNGSNIKLDEDGDVIWVSTFDGVSMYDTKSGQIKNFQQELAPGATKFSVHDIVVTPKAVYAHVGANAYSQGSIARYDKATTSWNVATTSDFGVTGPYPRIDFTSLVTDGTYIYADDGKKIWMRTDESDSKWSEIPGIIEEVKKNYSDYSNVRILTITSNGILLVANGEDFYEYDIRTKAVTKAKIESLTGDHRVSPTALWSLPFSSEKDNVWLIRTDLKSGNRKNITLKRPESFSRVLASIDNKPVVISNMGLILVYDYKQDEFINLTQGANMDSGYVQFYPIPNTQIIFIFSQSCGQLCDKPVITLTNYKTQQIEAIEYPKEIEEEIDLGGRKSITYSGMVLQNKGPKEFTFSFGSPKTRYATFNVDTKVWNITDNYETEPIDPFAQRETCNRRYTFDNNTFNEINCSQIVENDKYKWEVSQNGEIIKQIAKQTGETLELNLPKAPAPYSPFADWVTKQSFNQIVYAENKLWIGSNLGLIVYDPENNQSVLIDTSKGLLTNEITSFVVGEGALWATTNWGGFSLIPLEMIK